MWPGTFERGASDGADGVRTAVRLGGRGIWPASDIDAALSLQLAVQKAPQQLSLRVIRVGGVHQDLTESGHPGLVEISALYSRVFATPHFHLAASVGPGLAHRPSCAASRPECTGRTAPMLALGAEASLHFLPVAGLALQVFKNVNSINNNAGHLSF